MVRLRNINKSSKCPPIVKSIGNKFSSRERKGEKGV